MITQQIASRASAILEKMKSAGYKKGLWSSALKCSFRYESLKEIMPLYGGACTFQIVKKDGSKRVLKTAGATFKNLTLISVRDVEEDGKYKSFNIWQLMPAKDQPSI